MDWSSAGPLWQRQSAGESRWARTEAVGEGRATSPTSLQPLVPQMTQLLVQLALHLRTTAVPWQPLALAAGSDGSDSQYG